MERKRLNLNRRWTKTVPGSAILGFATLALIWGAGFSLAQAKTEEPVEVRPPEAGIVPVGPRHPGPSRIEIHPIPRPFSVSISTDRGTYYDGDSVRIRFRATRDAHVYIFNTDTNGVTRQIFPNYYDRDNSVRARATYSIPDRSYSLMVTGPAGRESLEIVAVSRRPHCLSPWAEFRRETPYPLRKGGARGLFKAIEEENKRLEKESRKERSSSKGLHGRATLRVGSFKGQLSGRDGLGHAYRPPAREIIPIPRILPVATARDETSFRVRSRGWHGRQIGHLQVTSSPSGASIYINGEYVGKSPQTVHLYYGHYEVEVRKPGYSSESHTLAIDSVLTKRIHFRLRREYHYPQPRWGW